LGESGCERQLSADTDPKLIEVVREHLEKEHRIGPAGFSRYRNRINRVLEQQGRLAEGSRPD
jgi:hypothetical protein